MAAEIFYNMQT